MKKLWIVVAVVVLAVVLGIYMTKQRAASGAPSVRVGAILPMTGTAANYGELMKRGISIAADECVRNRKPDAAILEVVIEDSKSNPKDGVSAIQKLLQLFTESCG